MSTLTDFRQAVKVAVKDGLDVDAVVDGRVIGPLENKTVSSVYPDRITRQTGNALVGQQFIVVRVVKKLGKGRTMPEQGMDPAPLEDLAAELEAVVKANQTSVGPWYMELLQIDFDLDAWAIEASIMGWLTNPAV